jgi:hypothetical protein
MIQYRDRECAARLLTASRNIVRAVLDAQVHEWIEWHFIERMSRAKQRGCLLVLASAFSEGSHHPSRNEFSGLEPAPVRITTGLSGSASH